MAFFYWNGESGQLNEQYMVVGEEKMIERKAIELLNNVYHLDVSLMCMLNHMNWIPSSLDSIGRTLCSMVSLQADLKHQIGPKRGHT